MNSEDVGQWICCNSCCNFCGRMLARIRSLVGLWQKKRMYIHTVYIYICVCVCQVFWGHSWILNLGLRCWGARVYSYYMPHNKWKERFYSPLIYNYLCVLLHEFDTCSTLFCNLCGLLWKLLMLIGAGSNAAAAVRSGDPGGMLCASSRRSGDSLNPWQH